LGQGIGLNSESLTELLCCWCSRIEHLRAQPRKQQVSAADREIVKSSEERLEKTGQDLLWMQPLKQELESECCKQGQTCSMPHKKERLVPNTAREIKASPKFNVNYILSSYYHCNLPYHQKSEGRNKNKVLPVFSIPSFNRLLFLA
jgi:hypothetical protein